ncbi:MAG: hypothetical protein HYY04_01110 [Chloroflexi bacterium]|nr:hypothetical protein [Chloroflexota bacterium]
MADRPTEMIESPAAEPVLTGPALTVGDGFRFGCGLILAGVAFYFLVVIAIALFALVAVIFDIPLPINLPGG